MPIAKRSFIRLTIAAIVFGAMCLLGIVGTALWLVDESVNFTDAVNTARRIRATTITVRGTLQDAETGQRGFLLTGSQNYLKPYNDAIAASPVARAAMREATAVDPQIAALTSQIDQLADEKFKELQETIDLSRAGKRDAAQEIVNADRGREVMDKARGIFDQIVNISEKRIGDGAARQRTAMNALRNVTIAGAVLIVLSLGGYTMVTLRYTRELQLAEQEVQQMNANLEERIQERTMDLARANEEIQRFAYIVTHDLRAPLVNIMGFTSELETSVSAVRSYVDETDPVQRENALADARVAATADLPEAIKFIRSSTRKMDGLINAILKLSREGRRTMTPVPIDLRGLLETAVESVRHQVTEAGGEITIEGKAPSLVSDRMALDQIFGNLLDNAVKYRAHLRPLRIHLRLREGAGQKVIVEVEDNGRGIAAQDHERVFDLFRRSGAQDKPGDGIGLAHVRAMARNLGGNITLVSELDRGSTFTLIVARDLRKIIQGK